MFCALNPCMGRVEPIDGSVSLHNGISLTQEQECSVPMHGKSWTH